MDGEVEHPCWLNAGKQVVIEDVLPQGLFQIGDNRWAKKTLDFNRNLLARLFRRQDSFGPKVNIEILAAPMEPEWIVGNRPAISRKGVTRSWYEMV